MLKIISMLFSISLFVLFTLCMIFIMKNVYNRFKYMEEEESMINLKIHRKNPNAILPTRGTKQSAGLDLYVPSDCPKIIITPNKTAIIDTGLVMDIPEGYWLGIYARSGMSFNKNLVPVNCVGVIDSDYTDTIKIGLHNIGTEAQSINPNDRIVQCVLHRVYDVEIEEVFDEIKQKTDRIGGFGSTGN